MSYKKDKNGLLLPEAPLSDGLNGPFEFSNTTNYRRQKRKIPPVF
ncbi:Uncharacterized protein XB16_2956 [Leptospira santarosai]|uniref:Uncharacterized protein n=1 Tax=Leptospira santarosai TaxID=28183 RepID=A0A2P1QWH6_9LEPT|nr:Uncharacterized protein XB16_2956 [Leptospira santarosai]